MDVSEAQKFVLTHKGERQLLVELNSLPNRSSAQRRREVYKSLSASQQSSGQFLSVAFFLGLLSLRWFSQGFLTSAVVSLELLKGTCCKHRAKLEQLIHAGIVQWQFARLVTETTQIAHKLPPRQPGENHRLFTKTIRIKHKLPPAWWKPRAR